MKITCIVILNGDPYETAAILPILPANAVENSA